MATPIPKNRASFSLAEIARATGGELVASDGELAVHGIVTDSRAIERGNLYVALRGERHDGHAFVSAALTGGATAALVSDRAALPQGALGIVCDDSLRALGDLAALHRKRWGGRVVAITGSAGKTTTKELTYAALTAVGAKAQRSLGNLNNLIGAPLTLLCLDAQTELCVLEIGTSSPGEIARLSQIAAPEVGVVVSVAAAHTLGLGTIEAVAAEKAALLQALSANGIAIFDADEPLLRAQLARVRATRIVGFGRGASAEVQLVAHALDAARAHKPSMRCTLALGAERRSLSFPLALFGIGPALDACAAIAVVRALYGDGVLEDAALGLFEVPPVAGRLQPRPGPAGSLVIDDSYNANPASMRSSIDATLELARARGGRALIVLGDMLELGDASREEHEAVGKRVAQAGVAVFVAAGVEMTAAAEVAREEARKSGHELSVAHLSDPAGAAQLVSPLLREHDVVLVKGSRSMAMERVSEQLARDAGARP